MSKPFHDLSPTELNNIREELKNQEKKSVWIIASGPWVGLFVMYMDLNGNGLITAAGFIIFLSSIIGALYIGRSRRNEICLQYDMPAGLYPIDTIDGVFSARRSEKAKDYDTAIQVWQTLGVLSKAARARELKAEFGSVKISQKVVHGDEVTEIKDSVLNRSNVGGKSSKAEELREAKSLLDEGLINENDYEKMKKEILGK